MHKEEIKTTNKDKLKLMKIQKKMDKRKKRDQVNKFQTKTMMIKVIVIFEIKYAIINVYRPFDKYIHSEHWGFIFHLRLLRLRKQLLVLQSVEPSHSINTQAFLDMLSEIQAVHRKLPHKLHFCQELYELPKSFY